METRGRTPNLFAYSLILPAIWFSIGALLQLVAPSIRLGTMGLAAIVFIYSSVVGWRFSRRFNRHLTTPEAVRLIAYSSCWAVISELLALYAYTSDRGLPLLDPKIDLVIGVTIAVDILFVSLGILRVARWRIESHLRKPAPPVT